MAVVETTQEYSDSDEDWEDAKVGKLEAEAQLVEPLEASLDRRPGGNGGPGVANLDVGYSGRNTAPGRVVKKLNFHPLDPPPLEPAAMPRMT